MIPALLKTDFFFFKLTLVLIYMLSFVLFLE